MNIENAVYFVLAAINCFLAICSALGGGKLWWVYAASFLCCFFMGILV